MPARLRPRVRRYLPGIANEVEPDQLVEAVREQPVARALARFAAQAQALTAV